MEWRPIFTVLLIVLAGAIISILVFPILAGLSGPPSVTKTDVSAADSSTVYQVGNGDATVSVTVVNEASTNRTIEVELGHNRTDSVLFSRTAVLERNEEVGFELGHGAGYLLTVTDKGTNTTAAYSVSQDMFDCNHHSGTVQIGLGGRMETGTTSTTMKCGSPPF